DVVPVLHAPRRAEVLDSQRHGAAVLRDGRRGHVRRALVVVLGAVLLTTLQRPGPHGVILRIAGATGVQGAGEPDRHPAPRGVEADRQMDRRAGVADAIEAAWLGPVAGPGE